MVGVIGELISSWCIPTPLFILLNVVIAILISIAVASSRRPDSAATGSLPRAPSSLFSKVTSFNLNSHWEYPNQEADRPEPVQSRPEPVEPGPVQAAPFASVAPAPSSLLSRVASLSILTLGRPDPARPVDETRAGREDEREDGRKVAPAVKGKSAAVRREKTPVRWEWDAEVDAKADDFISKFKLQRLGSLMRSLKKG